MSVVLVLDAEQRAALACVRSLGRAGHTVFTGSHRSSPLAAASRWSRGNAVLPDPLAQAAAYAEGVRSLVQRWKIDVVLPVTDASALCLLPHRDRIGAVIPFPAVASFERICDKAAVAEAARELGIGVPAQLRLDSPSAVPARLSDKLRFPVVVKPARSVSPVNGTRVRRTVTHASGPAAVQAALAALTPEEFPVLLQERIIGPGVGVFLLLHSGQVLAAFAHRRIREKPPSGGVSVYRESIELEPQLRDLSVALLKRFDWEGAAMVEYKIDGKTGKPYLMEVNGRFWGSLQLAIDAGVDFPALLIAAATGAAPNPVTSYRQVRSRWFWGDVDHLLQRLRRSPEELALEPGAPSRSKAFLQFISAFAANSRSEVFRWSDPAPALRETVDWLRGR